MRWHDYTYRGRWTHSCLYDDAGNYLAQCWPRYLTDNCTRIVHVQWETDTDGHEDESPTRRAAKRAVREHLRALASER